MARLNPIQHIAHRFDPKKRQRSVALHAFYRATGMVNFGNVHQHDDEYDPVRGFSSSLTHRDTNYAVGNYNDHDVRVVERYDSYKVPGGDNHAQMWVIFEINLHVRNMPHFFFVPTGVEGKSYSQLFTAQPYLQPINSYVATNHSPEFHGRYQIIARATKAREVNELVTSPIIVGIGTRFWPYGIEIEHGRLYVYITDPKLSKARLEQALASTLWLAETLKETHERNQRLQ